MMGSRLSHSRSAGLLVLLGVSGNLLAQPPLSVTPREDQIEIAWESVPLPQTASQAREWHPDYRLQTSVDLVNWTEVETTFDGGAFTEAPRYQHGIPQSGAMRYVRVVTSLDARDDDLTSLDLTGADLRDMDLRWADLSGTVLINADLRGADLRGADLRGADLTGAKLDNAKLDEANFLTTKGYTGNGATVDPVIDIDNEWFVGGGGGGPTGPVGPGGFLGDAAFDALRPALGGNLGFTVGGAKDINNFRDNIENNVLPLMTGVTHEGLFFDYFFDRAQSEQCEELFCPSFSYAVSADPISEKKEYYLSVGLNSGIKESDFERKDLNLVIVLDVSGSMGSSFDRYYYDGSGNQLELEPEEQAKMKMEVANEAVVSLLDHLRPTDRLAIVLFSSNARLFLDLTRVNNLDIEELSQQILGIGDGGSTNMSDGYQTATRLYDELLEIDPREEENRIIFLTDAQPNTGEISENGLLGMTKRNADNQIYTSFIGIGLDFNTDLIEGITDVRGSNYFSVHSPEQFDKRMNANFEFMVTPLVFGLEMTLESDDFAIDKVYGSPQADESTGRLLKVDTLFPSETNGGETKGGIVLLKLRKKKLEIDTATLNLSVRYEDRLAEVHENTVSVTIEDDVVGRYDNRGIRKGILLARYANLLQNWIFDERRSYERELPCDPIVTLEDGIVLPPFKPGPELGQWERRSVSLFVSRPYRKLFEQFREHFANESEALEDPTLDQEDTILKKLSEFGGSSFWLEDDLVVTGE